MGSGLIGVKESAYGFLNLLGETSENEWLTEVGEASVIRAGKQLQERGSILVDYKDCLLYTSPSPRDS